MRLRYVGLVLPVCTALLLCPPVSAQQITVTRTVVSPITNFNINYFDLTGSGGGPTLFALNITPASPSDTALYYIRFTARCTTSVVTTLLYQGRTGDFRIGAGIVLTSNEFFVDQGPDAPGLHTTTTQLDDPNAQRILLVSGIVPTGRIHLGFELVRVSDTQTWTSDMVIDIVSIRYVRPIAPGIDASLGGEWIPEVYTPYPQFIWNSDLLPVNYSSDAVKFVVSVFENPQGSMGLSDITESRPLWSTTIPGDGDANFAQYPVAGARALISGHKYYWQVKAVLQGPEMRELAGELYVFRVADLQYAELLNPLQRDILRYLQVLLGSNYGYIMEQLHGMTPEGTIVLDGKAIDIEDLADIARKSVLGQRNVRKVGLE